MAHRFSVEALDLTLQDLMKDKQLFGSKCAIFSGDVRQTEPTVIFGTEQDMLVTSIISGPL